MLQNQSWPELFAQLGPMGWPLLAVSALAMALLLERLLLLFSTGYLGAGKAMHKLRRGDRSELAAERSLASRAAALLLQHRSADKNRREEVAAVWLQDQRRRLHSGLRLLMVIGIVSPLMGLLGTVLGLIDMFAGIEASGEPVTPALLADGLGMALSTTAAGLLIALPAIAGAHLLGIWSDRLVADLEHLLNRGNLWLEGIDPCADGQTPVPAEAARA